MKRMCHPRGLRTVLYSAAFMCAAIAFSGCTDFFTTSWGEAFAQDPDFSSLSFSELIDAANTYGAKDSAAAKEIMKNLADEDGGKLTSLSVSDKTAVLNTAANAAYSLDSVLDLIDEIKEAEDDDSDSDDIIDKVFELFDKDADVTAAKILLDDEQTRNKVPVDTLILSAAALMASVDESDTESIKNAVESKSTGSLPADVKGTADTVIEVIKTLETRSTEVFELGDSLGFDLTELLPGFTAQVQGG